MDHRWDHCRVRQWLESQVLHSLDTMSLYRSNKRIFGDIAILALDLLLHDLEALLVIGLHHGHHICHGELFELGVGHDVAEEAESVGADCNPLGLGVVAQKPREGLRELDCG